VKKEYGKKRQHGKSEKIDTAKITWQNEEHGKDWRRHTAKVWGELCLAPYLTQ
jgi:hypothetical protein